MKRRTKIVCTLGPAVDSRDGIAALIDAGMNVARINCSHGGWETRSRWIGWIRELSPEVSPVAIMVDLQGPKFRIGALPNDAILLETGSKVSIGGPSAAIPVERDEIVKAMELGSRALLGDGEIELRIVEHRGHDFEAVVVSGGLLKSHKGITLVNKSFDIPALTDKDIEDVQNALGEGADFVALSYVKNSADVRELRRVVERFACPAALCAKIETREAIENLEDILKVSDAVMVARGDMGLQMEIEDVPLLQKKIIRAGMDAGKPTITATQMLESMLLNPRPTRAEATDIANAVLDGTDALMLSGETATGKYPIECVKTMARIAENAEVEMCRQTAAHESRRGAAGQGNRTDAIADGVCSLAEFLQAKAIVTTTSSGQTARLVSKFRPSMPILCATWNQSVQRQMAMVWGVETIHMKLPGTTDEVIQGSIDAFLRKKLLKCGDLVAITAGVPPGTSGNTNMILTHVVN